MHTIRVRITASFLSIALLVGAVGALAPIKAEAAGRTLTLSAAKQAAVANSAAYEKIEGKIETKQVSLIQAIRSINEKKRNMSTFRWTPLLSFKFPVKPDLSEASEFTLKPIGIQAEIDTLKHQLNDQKLTEYETISNLYVDILTLEETLAFNRERLAVLEDTLKKSRAKLRLGQAKQADIDTMEKSASALTNKIASDTRNLENSKKKLGQKIGMDVTTGYSFQNAFIEAAIERSKLSQLIQYTLERDQGYYNACMDEQTARVTLRTNYNLMQGQYGGNMGMISSYVRQAESGEKINTKAFKKQYEAFLKRIDEPWQGKKKILFIRVPKEWFKGQIDGIRYVEDEPYALYEAALELQDAIRERESAKTELEQLVEDTFNNYVSMRNAYLASVQDVKDAKKQLDADKQLNRLGELTYDEYKTSLDDYEDLQNAMFESLSAYSKTLYSFDRLTCGGISELLQATGGELSAGAGGQSYVTEEYAEGAYYYIEGIIQEQMFRLGVHIPDNFDVPVTHFELWCDNVQIGPRTAVDKTIRHLALSTDNIEEAKIRFYNNADFVDDCIIDPEELSGPLTIVKNYKVVEGSDPKIGEYTYSLNETSGIVTITLKPDTADNIAGYVIRDAAGTALISKNPISIKNPFTYLSLMLSDMADLTIEFYDGDDQLLYKGYFETSGQRLMKKQEGQ